MRDAVFFLMNPLFADLSIALYAAASFSPASFPDFAEMVRATLTVSFIVRLRRRLTARLRADDRRAFFAALMIGIEVRGCSH